MERWRLVIRHRGALLLTMMAMVALGSVGCKATPTEKVMAVSPRVERVEAVPTGAERAAAPRVSADEIYTVYNRTLITGGNANQRYLNRLMWVSGVFDGVTQSGMGHTYLKLRTHDEDSFAYASLNADATSLLSALVPGTGVELLCRGGGALGGNPLLWDCRGR